MKEYIKDMKSEEAIKRLKNGEILKIEDSAHYFKNVDGVICHIGEDGKILLINAAVDPDIPVFYFEKKEEFKITEPGLYKAKCGKMVFITYKNLKGEFVGVVEECGEFQKWNKYGILLASKTGSEKFDIISKWKD